MPMFDLNFTEFLRVAFQIAVSMVCGIAIGLERSYNGRAAGTRTYTLVCLASTVVMQAILMLKSQQHLPGSIDVSRVIQGIMTGIGFLGAGVIVKDGFNVRGLTTAAAIWMASVVGTLAGIGMETLAICSALLTVFILVGYRHIEKIIPGKKYDHLSIKVTQAEFINEEAIEKILEECGFSIVDFSYKQSKEKKHLEYKLIIWTKDKRNNTVLAKKLYAMPGITEFGMSPSSD